MLLEYNKWKTGEIVSLQAQSFSVTENRPECRIYWK